MGRDAELLHLREDGPGLIAVVGPPGVGKSALVAAARPAALWIDASASTSVEDVAAVIAQRLGVDGAAPDSVARALVASDVRDVVLDQVDALDPASLSALRAWVDLAPALRVGVTCRARPDGVPVLELAPLSEADAVRVLRAEAGGLVAEALLPDLARALDCLPQALRFAGRRLRLLPAATLLADPALAADPDRLANLAAGSLERLTASARKLLGRLCLFEGPVPIDHAIELVGTSGLDALQELRDASLLQASEQGIRLYSAVRHAARRELTGEDAARARHVHQRYVARRLEAEDVGADVGPELEAAVRRLLRLDDVAAAAALLAAASPHVERWGPGNLAQLVDRCLSALPPSATLRGVLLLLRARLHLGAHRLEPARRDAAEARDLLPHDLEPARLLAHACIRLGDLPGAEDALRKGLTTTQGAPELLMERGLLFLDQGDGAAARADFQAARDAFPVGPKKARAELRRALAALQNGDHADGVPALHRIRGELADTGHDHLVAVANWYLGWAALEAGDDALATGFVRDALATWTKRGDVLGEARARGLLGVIALLEGDLATAGRCFDDAEAAREALGRPRFTVLLLEARAILLSRQGRAAEARATIAHARALADGMPARVTDGLERTRLAVSGTHLVGPSRLRSRLLSSLKQTVAASPRASLEATVDGRWFRVGAADPVDISRRAAQRRILAALLTAESPLDIHAVVEAGWPGERLHPEAGRARAYTAIRSLRRFGLQDILVRIDDGYALDPAVPVTLRS